MKIYGRCTSAFIKNLNNNNNTTLTLTFTIVTVKLVDFFITLTIITDVLSMELVNKLNILPVIISSTYYL